MTDTPDNVVSIHDATPSTGIKSLDWSDKRARCQHARVLIWEKEPIAECRDCGAILDPFMVLRRHCNYWRQMTAPLEAQKAGLEAEIAGLKKALKALKGEFATEAEKRAADRALHIWPGRKPR